MNAVDSARAAFLAREWDSAYEHFHTAAELSGDDLDALAETAHWLGREDEAIDAYTRAYRRHVDDGADRRAALSAFMLAIHLRVTGDGAHADGWLARSRRLLDDAEEGAEHGYPLYLQIAAAMGVDLDAAGTMARQMQDIGRRHGDDTLVALGRYFEGRALVKQARVAEGLALLDEAMLAAVADDLEPMWTGAIYCGLLDACHELVDLRRAHQWTEATRRWCSPLPVASLYPGICRVHWAEVLDLRGSWSEAEAEALDACRELVTIDVFAVADGYYQVGDIRRRRGDLAGAEDAYTRARELGRDPQPGHALLLLALGRNEAASASVGAALATYTGSRLGRAPLLAGQAEVALATGDLELAETVAAELTAIASDFDTVGLRAIARRCTGAVALARGQAVAALAVLRQAQAAWNELDVPYEVARTHVLIARAYRALDDFDSATRECAAARSSFERLGATADLRALEDGPAPPCGLTAREVEVLRSVAKGLTNREIAEGLFISDKTVARHLANVYVKIDVSSRSAATAFAFEHDLVQ